MLRESHFMLRKPHFMLRSLRATTTYAIMGNITRRF